MTRMVCRLSGFHITSRWARRVRRRRGVHCRMRRLACRSKSRATSASVCAWVMPLHTRKDLSGRLS